MDFDTLTTPEPIPGDEHGYANAAFRRAAAVCRHGDIESVEEFWSFLEAEAAECDRQANYLRGMSKYFHENAAKGQEMEAKAMRVMLGRTR